MRSLAKRIILLVASISAFVIVVGIVMVVLGYRPFILSSSSMEPLYPKGSLVFVNTRVSVSDIAVGDVIAYRTDTNALVLHRYVGKNQLQGDANETAQTVMLDKTNFIGREVFNIPSLGMIAASLLKHRIVIYVVAGVLVVIACLPHKTPKKKEV